MSSQLASGHTVACSNQGKAFQHTARHTYVHPSLAPESAFGSGVASPIYCQYCAFIMLFIRTETTAAVHGIPGSIERVNGEPCVCELPPLPRIPKFLARGVQTDGL